MSSTITIQFHCSTIIFYLPLYFTYIIFNNFVISIYFISRTAFDIKEMINFSNPPPADPKSNSNANNHHHRQWPPPQPTMTSPPPPQMQQQNWHWPSMHPQQQFQYDYGQQYAPARHYMMQPPNPAWQHQYYPQHQNRYVPNHQQENWSSEELRRTLSIQLEITKELKK
jgi:hypothetical protein